MKTGDLVKVINKKNEWYGDIGKLESIDPETKKYMVRLNDGWIEFNKNELKLIASKAK